MTTKTYARLTIDMNPEEHAYLKMVSAELKIPMREFILLAAFEKMGQIQNQWLSEKAKEFLFKLKNK
jgi:hypothetical protein